MDVKIPEVKVAPSILSADFGKLNEDIATVDDVCDLIHVDVMDGHFVPNITIGQCVVKGIRAKKPLDVHLMIENPEKYVEEFAKAIKKSAEKSSDVRDFVAKSIITIHVEACDDDSSGYGGCCCGCGNEVSGAAAVLKQIRELGCRSSICVKPGTDVAEIEPYLDLVDMVLVMTVEPGFGGQEFMEDMMSKVRRLRELKPEMDIEVDGGINVETAAIAREAGANVLVAGSYIFKAEDRVKAAESLRG